MTYALSAALRQRRRFELRAAVVDPASGAGVLIAGKSGSGKSTMAVHLASAGWPFLTDDVLLLGAEPDGVATWPLRRRFAISPETTPRAASSHAHRADDQRSRRQAPFMPHAVFAGGFRDRCRPGVLLFPELTGAARTEVARLATEETMASDPHEPVVCYDRSTAPLHLEVLSRLAQQTAAYTVRAGRDLLEPSVSVDVVAGCVREALDR